MRSAGVLSSEVVFEGGVVPMASHCLCRGRGNAQPGLNSVFLGNLEGNHSPESWSGGEGHDSLSNRL